MRIGFIGTGSITTAIVTGLCKEDATSYQIWVSARNKDSALSLENTYDQVSIGASNQTVVDNADLLFLAFLPGMEDDILSTLVLRPDQVVVSLLAGVSVSKVKSLTAPAKSVVRAIPLPCTALCTGPVVMFPGNDHVFEIFSQIGSVLIPEQEDQLGVFSMITALMAPFYALTDTVAAWGESKGLDRSQAAVYTASMFKALALIAETVPQGNIHGLVADSMTPGGLNETAMNELSGSGGFSNIVEALNIVSAKFNK